MKKQKYDIIWLIAGCLILYYGLPWGLRLFSIPVSTENISLLVLNPIVVFVGMLLYGWRCWKQQIRLIGGATLSGVLFFPSVFLFYESQSFVYGFYNLLIGFFAILVAYQIQETREKKRSGKPRYSVWDEEEQAEEHNNSPEEITEQTSTEEE